ncbi:MAG: DUF4389 domain-containing protein [Colwellia sp.]|nr:DUF4389 domain-containing protein [Colwellia sp.]MCW8863984.1 DUF4389 domain-containing protein [Colwellia sp.]MCW9080077.1 DUF4389 domain-containing protein [Colwellia sp.]
MNNDENKVTHSSEAQHEAVSQNETASETVDKAPSDAQLAQRQTAHEQSSHEEPQEQNTNEVEEEKTWHNKNALKRGIAMLGYGFIAGFVRLGITLIAVFQFLSLLFAEKPNIPLVKFGQNLNTFLYQINQFLTVNSEMYPFPFADWPDSAPKE